ncbi:MAG: 4-(cytidine 5'-diphospho)-2-C-methyl-D-erythritol kinase [Planctomycetes bacterium]|jgi:4-diphosphocytidyl-2-C-methyl-D-erythritol kinase|nr:4-(cytidine 5'-diphospho)-2-C-methyl-D-erythritol kinase [Planctomycetota bacterium]
MHISTYCDDIVVWAPAKANLFLEVVRKRPDGYHEIATLMVAVRLFDTLVLRAAATPALDLNCSDASLSTGADNLVVKAARLLQDRMSCKLGASIRLIKRIPMAAGLAGGSSDAAATLLGLNRLWQLGMPLSDLANLSAELGSDIPFFFHTPAAWCTGRGEIVTPVALPRPLHFVLLCPSFGLATARVYQNVIVPSAPMSGAGLQDAFAKGEVDLIAKSMHNRLQLAAEAIDSRVAEYARMLAEAAPVGQLMSGSGSTLFALCRSAEDANRIAASLTTRTKAHDFRLIVTRTV